MARKFEQFGCQFHGAHDHRISGVKSGLPDLHLVETLAPASTHRVRQRSGTVISQPECLADLANGAAWPVVNDGRNIRCAMAAIATVDRRHYLLAAGILEIDSNVGRLLARRGNE